MSHHQAQSPHGLCEISLYVAAPLSVEKASGAASPDNDAVALAGLFSRVFDQPRGPWDAEDLASALGVSRTTLYRSVKRHHGTSPARKQ